MSSWTHTSASCDYDDLLANSWPTRNGYLLLVAVLIALFTLTFSVVEQLQIPLLTDPSHYLEPATWPVAILGISLLAADVILPVPSSGVMIAHAQLSTVYPDRYCSLAGSNAATLVAYLVGRRSRGLVDRVVTEEQQHRGAELLHRHEMWAIAVTRPVPILAETVALRAGAGRAMPGWKVTIAGAIGNLVPATAYAATGPTQSPS